ncbi:EAL domain-containing protein [Zoogloea sp.]|uniref:EAL domain-containing protein n=1 Tax=Zoogloea sp. TaxID=49181 RepID=UPI001416928C|nr:MAG: EAL domain-containing protein [Zoogloea sp.]
MTMADDAASPRVPSGPAYQLLFESAPGLYLVLNPALTIVAVNDAYARATRTSRDEIVGKPLFEVFPDNPDDPGSEGVRNLRASLTRVLQTCQPDAMPVQKYDIRRPAEEGGGFESRYWSPLNTPVTTPDGQLAYIIHRVEDVTDFVRLKQQGIEEERLTEALREKALRMETEVFARAREVADASARLKQANEELDSLYRKARELDELKTRFFGNVSHELRTPLTLILGPLDRLLASPRIDAEERKALQVMQRNARLLHRQVDNLLDLARLDAGRLILRYTDFDLAWRLRVLASNFDTVAHDRRITYLLAAPDRLDVQADAEKCERILLNLVANAFKFVPDGGAIGIRLSLDGPDLQIEVEDSGPGIPGHLREAVFERFRQVEDASGRVTSGTGLGLAIVREFVRLHHGEVTVGTSSLGGAHFIVRLPTQAPAGSLVHPTDNRSALPLPVEVVPSDTPEVAQAPAGGPDEQAPLILVVEDNPDMNAFIASALAPRYRVATAFDGQSGLRRALELRPALVLSDVMMPLLSGDRMVEALRQYHDLDDMPIVMLTAKADDALRTALLQHRVQDYIQKPFSIDELRARIAGLLQERSRTRRRLRSIEERFRSTFEQAAVGLAHVSPDGHWLRVNQKLCDIVGYTHDELLGLTFQDITHPDDLDSDVAQVQRLLARDIDSYALDKRYIGKAGNEIWIHLTVALIRDDDGTPDYFISVVEDIRQRKEAEHALRESEERFRLIAATIPEVIWLVDVSSARVAYVSPAYESLWQSSLALLYRNPLSYLEALAPADRGRVDGEKRSAILAGRDFELEYRILRPDGTARWLREHGHPLPARDGEAQRYVGIVQDITERRAAEERLRLSATVFENAREGVIITDADNTMVAVNRAFTDITGYSEAEALGSNPRLLRSSHHGREFFQCMWNSITLCGQWQGELWNRRKDGEPYPCWLTVSSVLDADRRATHYVGLLTDISQMRRSEEQVARLAHYDPLTELPNRLLLQSRLEHALDRARRAGQRLALLFINLDHFQTINDSLGHQAGDLLLLEVSRRLRQRVRQEDSLGRLGGDEFLLILESVQHPETAIEAAQAILASIAAPASLPDGTELYLSASIGISLYPDDGHSAHELLRDADAALHQAKAQGRNRFCFYTASMNADALTRLEMGAALRKALERQEFVLYYQPKVDLASGRICGAEALIRWQRADGRLESPARFIPLAESTGLIVPIGAWVIEEASRQIAAWRRAGLPDSRIALNVSARQFESSDLQGSIAEALARHQVPPHCVELELTESMLMEEPERTIEILRELKHLEIKLSLDDFGTGYSSFGYLSRFPIDTIKIDQSFVRTLATERQSALIAVTIIDLAHRLGLRVVAEGVETPAQLAYLRQKGCDEIQGYYFSRPVPADVFGEMLRSGRGLPPGDSPEAG